MRPAVPGRLLVVTWRFPALSETFVVGHVAAMAERGWRVAVCCAELDEEALAAQPSVTADLEDVTVLGEEVTAPGGLELARCAVGERQWRAPRSGVARHVARLAPALRRVVADLRPALVHAHIGPNAAAAAQALGGAGPPLLADLHGFDLTEVPASEGWGAYRRLLGDATVVVHSGYAARLVASGLGVEPVLVPYDTSPAFRPVGRSDHWTAPLRLLFVGRLVPQKGADLAVEALARLHARQPHLDARLTVVGQGPAERDVRRRADREGVGDRVSFVGPRAHEGVARVMADHDVLLVPSRPSPSGWVEALGLVAVEGTRSGMGVVASRSGGLPEAVGDTGVLVAPDDAEALASGIETLLDRSSPASLVASAEAASRTPSGDHHDRPARELLAASVSGGAGTA